MTKQHTVFLAIGTNLGQREENLSEALRALAPKVRITAVARLYETEPAYVLDQPNFLNSAARGVTELPPQELLDFLKELEVTLGRKKVMRNGPRKIDLDILFYEDWVVDAPHLHIPHPRMQERGFVLRPLADIGPEVAHPLLGKTVAELLNELPEDDGILRVTEWTPLDVD